MTLDVKTARLANGLKLPYVEQGDTSGVAVVFVHAYVESWRYFERLLTHLPPSIHAFAMTQRGHGRADRPASDTRSRTSATTSPRSWMPSAWRRPSSPARPAAATWRSASPSTTRSGRSLALIGAPRSLGDKPAAADLLATVSELRDPVDRAVARELIEATLSRPLPAEVLEMLVEESRQAPAHVWRAALAGLLEAVPPTETGRITARTLIVWGDRDAFLPPGDQESLTAAIRGSRLVTYEGAGHALLLEQPARIAADVAAFALRAPR